MSDRLLALVTGANKGIGFAVARRLGRLGVEVLLGARDEERGQRAADALTAEGIVATPLHLDVTDSVGVSRAADRIARDHDRLDILVNNAGTAGRFDGTAREASAADFREVYETNVFGVVAVTQAMLPLLLRSPAGRIVNVSSHLASLTLTSEPGSPLGRVDMIAYQTSKTALNAVTAAYARHLRDTTVKVNAALPGMVATDLNHHRGDLTPAEGAEIAVRLALLEDAGPSGSCVSVDGPVPW